MVRLKATFEAKISEFTYISIPYGAIKSSIIANTTAVINKFQFLMVRLKGNLGLYLITFLCNFNSLWCD